MVAKNDAVSTPDDGAKPGEDKPFEIVRGVIPPRRGGLKRVRDNAGFSSQEHVKILEDNNNYEARPTAPLDMPNGDEPPPEAKPETTRSIFTAAANPQDIGVQLKAARVRAGVTQASVAEDMGTKENAIRRLEKGEHSPSVDTIQKYASAIGYEVGLSFTPLDS